jgi:hypothetical protein
MLWIAMIMIAEFVQMQLKMAGELLVIGQTQRPSQTFILMGVILGAAQIVQIISQSRRASVFSTCIGS